MLRLFGMVVFGVILLVFFSVVSAKNLPSQLSIDFTDIKIKDLIALLLSSSGKNAVISEKVVGRTNIKLQNSSWREALDVVLQLYSLAKYETSNTITILPTSDLAKIDPSATAISLRYASAESTAKLLGASGLLSAGGKVGVEARTNTLVLADSNEKVLALKRIISQIDLPVRQVAIAARIVSVDVNFVRALGVEFGAEHFKAAAKVGAASGFGKFNFTLVKLKNNSSLDVALEALEHEGHGQVISRPHLLTIDRQSAYIEAGAEVPYQEKTKRGDISVSFKKAVLSLKVTPEIMAKDTINLILQLNQDKVSSLTVNGEPAIDTRKIETQVLVPNGETIVLGGIYEWNKSKHTTSVPVLGKIPILGLLFRKQETRIERKELLLFVTPRIVG